MKSARLGSDIAAQKGVNHVHLLKSREVGQDIRSVKAEN